MIENRPEGITQLLQALGGGDSAARARLVAAVYPELRKLAQQQMRRERPDHSLQPTALVHEVFLRLAGIDELAVANRGHFFALAAQLMRQILVDHARRRQAVKRGAGLEPVEIREGMGWHEEHPELLVEVDRLLTRLETLDRRQAQVVEMRFFSGFSEGEIAEALSVSERTVKRDWTMARAWLSKELSRR